ncbi:MAG: hypothetical protein WA733_16130 [Methylocystis sp.]
MEHLYQTILDGITYDIIKIVFAPMLITAAATFLMKTVFHKLSTSKEMIYFAGTFFVLVFLVADVFGVRNQQPNLSGGIQQIMVGGIRDNKDSIVIITVTIMNSGSMQSIVKNWNIEATINGNSYQGAVISPAPKSFTFTSTNSSVDMPTGITFHGEDDVIEKALKPVQPGGLATGVLFVDFKDLDPAVFKVGADFKVSYEDVFSKKYILTMRTAAKSGPISSVPGTHSDLVCPIPPSGMPKL